MQKAKENHAGKVVEKAVERKLGTSLCHVNSGRSCVKRSNAAEDAAKDVVDGSPNVHTKDVHI